MVYSMGTSFPFFFLSLNDRGDIADQTNGSRFNASKD